MQQLLIYCRTCCWAWNAVEQLFHIIGRLKRGAAINCFGTLADAAKGNNRLRMRRLGKKLQLSKPTPTSGLLGKFKCSIDIFGCVVFDRRDGHQFFRGEPPSQAKTCNRSLVETYFKS